MLVHPCLVFFYIQCHFNVTNVTQLVDISDIDIVNSVGENKTCESHEMCAFNQSD